MTRRSDLVPLYCRSWEFSSAWMKPATGRISGRWWSRRRRGKWPDELGGQRAGVRTRKATRLAECHRWRRPAPAESRPARSLPPLAQHRLRAQPATRHIAIADSKALYKPGLGLRQLERGVHAVLAAIDQSGCRVGRRSGAIVRRRSGRIVTAHLCWHDGFDCRLPIDATADELAPLGDAIGDSVRRGRRPAARDSRAARVSGGVQ